MKKLVSLLLALCMLCSIAAVASAEGELKKVTISILGNYDERNHAEDRSDCPQYLLDDYEYIRHELLPGYEIEIQWRLYDDRQQQLVRPQGFYPEPANPIPCQIQQKDFPIKPLVSGKQDQKNQKNQIPQRFIEKRGMYLDIRDTIYFHHVLQQAVRHIRGSDGRKRQLHGKQPVRITAKCLPVKEISPPADNLS